MANLKQYVVRPGDYLAKLAVEMGFDADEVWGHKKNKELADRRENPNILYQGDLLFVPQKPPAELKLQSESENEYEVDVPTVGMDLVLEGEDGPLESTDCIIYGLGDPLPKTTEPDGHLLFDVPISVSAVTVEIPSLEMVCRFEIGHLDPIGESPGVEQRLHNLGFLNLAELQQQGGLDVTGELDDDTRQLLLDLHGC